MKKKKLLIIIYLSLVLVMALIIYLAPSIAGMLEQTYIAEYGTLKTVDEVEACIIRDETVYVAPESGKINRLMEEGMLLKQGTKVVQFSGKGSEEADSKYVQVLAKLGKNIESNIDNLNQAAGVVTYHVDGYEKILNPENISEFTKEKLDTISKAEVLNIDEANFYKGDPIFKIVNNGGWYIIYFIENSRANLYEEGKSVTVQFSDDNVECLVDSIDEIDNYTRIVLSCNRYYIRYPYVRAEDISVLISEEQGVIIENKSIFELDGQTGVYLKNKLDENVFKPVKIITTDNENSVVYSKYYNGTDGMPVETIEPYDEVVKSPKVSESSKEE
ncbi:MAG: hypothetical protein JJE03_05035 [Peptostreptococcaceae bacterium]|nr:hypothetical protein [Peptostreptococcaceae bacterium]